MDCERNIELTSEEVKNLMIRVQKFNSIRTIDLIIRNNPNIVGEFDMDESIFANVETELLYADKIVENGGMKFVKNTNCKKIWGSG